MSLSLRDVSMRYGSGPWVLDGVDFDVDDGETVAVMGPSGSGKTTLISILGLLMAPASGSVLIDSIEAPVSEADRHRLRSVAFGWVFQTVNVLGRRSAIDNVAIPLLASGSSRDSAELAAVGALARVGLADRAADEVRDLSGGELQRVCIARALAHRPRFLLADEPTGQLDHATSVRVLDALQDLVTDSGSGMVIVTHDPQVAEICDRTVALVDGRLEPA
ncbi:MAG TPA: ABC transporter ATP-binding protein [Acidimicrobiia bacterium]|nr:ABC transporter ATP-binding protein [Acidimicrobiia bacterium]